ncbi:imidazoleglycerol-phosphate dehydratase HisB [Candidatus Nitronereus thalassa]|uniref:Imidazoleglycerol-phosphate dehydratase n=1 Tax=Candidatus Nitronereus thalassa TaxID=3020898 RepID=A0ABU3KAH2_9BACT|nr:imidazoleglycerol-phosphate dehydratase HisB [Candidatus Nitronereus thalassa]MDT7043425.1 imidazoleglycerol-phosphate dehydratase HisB [Candidatus Nitronereus thalassa]
MSKNSRSAKVNRTTSESSVHVEWSLDGTGTGKVNTTIPFVDHMLNLLAKHGLFDLVVEAKGDTEIDHHHTVEDIGIVLGSALKEALGEKTKIRRFGWAIVPLDETLAEVVVDLSGRPFLVYNVEFPHRQVKDFDLGLFEDFFQALVSTGALNLHVNVKYGRNSHHIIEAVFKAFAKALDQATMIDDRVSGVLSTKGSL